MHSTLHYNTPLIQLRLDGARICYASLSYSTLLLHLFFVCKLRHQQKLEYFVHFASRNLYGISIIFVSI